MEENKKEHSWFYIQKPIDISKIDVLVLAVAIFGGAHLFLWEYLGEYYTMIFIGFVLLSLFFTVLNIRLKKMNGKIIYANLAGFIMPLIAACYFLAIIIFKLNLLIIILSVAIVSAVEIKRTKVEARGCGGMAVFAVTSTLALAIVVPFSASSDEDLLMLRLFFMSMAVILAAIISDLYFVYKNNTDIGSNEFSIGANGIFDGIWIGGFAAILVPLILHDAGILDLTRQIFI